MYLSIPPKEEKHTLCHAIIELITIGDQLLPPLSTIGWEHLLTNWDKYLKNQKKILDFQNLRGLLV
jgi:hypothetical protein